MGLLWKRFFLKFIGAYLVLGVIFDPDVFQPMSTDERANTIFAKAVITGIGILMIVRGSKLKHPPPKE